MSEIVWIHIGQTGIQIGQKFWELIMKEHGIGRDGRVEEKGSGKLIILDVRMLITKWN